jgi:DNA recombination protein RmuC
MALNLIIATLLAATVGLITYVLTRRRGHLRAEAAGGELAESKTAFSVAKADFDARQEELRHSVNEARERENAAKTKVSESEQRYSEIAAELKIALEEKGHFQNEATRVEEVKAALLERGTQIQSLNIRVTDLEREKTEALKDAEAANKRATEMVGKEREARHEIVSAKDEQIAKLNDFISQARDVLTTEFKALSADALKDASAQLIKTADSLIEKHGEKTTADVKLHQQHIETMLKPVEETIKRLDKHVEDSDLARTKAEALLDDQVKRLAGASESLTNALRKPVVRGSWGEMTLENALENAGLEAEIDFILQHYTDAEDGRKRTDAIINLPKGRKLIIDSKNLMESYLALASTDDEAQKAVLAETHSKSLKNHIRSLSAKEYWRRYEGLDCVILFIPHEGMYHAAIRDEAELIREACEKRVFISNPMSLIPLLKAIRYVLDQERLNKSAEEISKVGAELYGEVARFAESMAKIGNRLKSTVNAYNDAIPGLDRFIVAKSRTLKQLGSGKGAEAELPEAIEIEPRFFSSRELRPSNSGLEKDDMELVGAEDRAQ